MTAETTIRPLPTRNPARDLMLAERVAQIPGATLEGVKAYDRSGGVKTYHLIIRHEGDAGHYQGAYWLDYEGFADLEMNATPAKMALYLWQKRYSLYAGWERLEETNEYLHRYIRDYGQATGQIRHLRADRIGGDNTAAIAEREESAQFWGARLDTLTEERNQKHERVIAIVGARPE
jgi:hypothetical protein